MNGPVLIDLTEKTFEEMLDDCERMYDGEPPTDKRYGCFSSEDIRFDIMLTRLGFMFNIYENGKFVCDCAADDPDEYDYSSYKEYLEWYITEYIDEYKDDSLTKGDELRKKDNMVHFGTIDEGKIDTWSQVLMCGDVSVWYYYTEEDDEPFGYFEMGHTYDERIFEKYWYVVAESCPDWKERIYHEAEIFYYEKSQMYEEKE